MANNGCMVGVDHMLNIDSIRSEAGRDRLAALSRVYALSEARGTNQNRKSEKVRTDAVRGVSPKDDGCKAHIRM